MLVEAEQEVALLVQVKGNLLACILQYLHFQWHLRGEREREAAIVDFSLRLAGVQGQHLVVDFDYASVLDVGFCIDIILLNFLLYTL